MIHYCQSHNTLTVAVEFYRHRYRCAACITAMKDTNGRANHHRVVVNKSFLNGYAIGKIEPSAPTVYTPPQPYVVPKVQLDAEEKALAYSWRTLPSKYE